MSSNGHSVGVFRQRLVELHEQVVGEHSCIGLHRFQDIPPAKAIGAGGGLLTGGAAGTEVVSVRVFNYLTARGDIGAAAAQALVLAVILAVLVTFYLKVFGRSEESA